MDLAQLVEFARAAEQGQADRAAQAAIGACADADAGVLEALMRYAAAVPDAEVEDFLVRHDQCYQIRVPRLGDFWLAPLSAWAQLPAGARVVSPRGLKALGLALIRALGVAA